jgi:basic membrane lipoprotein Med (substrate-binding protein (PBP1-ABC) superfamily)
LVGRSQGRLVLLGLCAVAVMAGIGLAVSGAPLPWSSSGGSALPASQTKARVYESVDACLLTGPQGLADPAAAQSWAGMEQASKATTARVSYLAATGPGTEAAAEPFAGSLLVSGCKVVVAAGVPERAALLAEASRFAGVRFVVAGPAAGSPSNVTVLAFAPAGLQAAVASAVEVGVHAAGG